MKSLSEKINWYNEPEDREWKRIWHCAELLFISISTLVVVIVVQLYGNGTKLQSILVLFILFLSASSIGMILPFYNSTCFRRWQIQLVSLGLGCGAGISAVAAFLILELQHVSS